MEDEILRATRGMFSLSALHVSQLDHEEQLDVVESDVSADSCPGTPPSRTVKDPLMDFESSFAAHCAGFEAIRLPWVMLKAGTRRCKQRRGVLACTRSERAGQSKTPCTAAVHLASQQPGCATEGMSVKKYRQEKARLRHKSVQLLSLIHISEPTRPY